MRHGWYPNGILFGQNILWVVLIFIIAILVSIIFFLVLKKRTKSTGTGGNPQAEVENIEGLIRSMLVQAGAGLNQYEICSNLGLPKEIVSAKLNAMEKAGAVVRIWKNEDYTYFVSLPKNDETAGNGP